jgi:hypothetical protein
MSRTVEILNVTPRHPGRGEPSEIVMAVVLRYLRGEPVEAVVLTRQKAVELIEQLARAIRATEQ